MDKRLELAFKEKVACLVCEQDNARILGVRGNREYNGADPAAVPHLFTNVVECRNCGFIYTDPQIKGIEFLEGEHYNRPEEYQAEAGNELTRMYEHRIEFIKRFKPNGTLLDIGAGKGYFVKAAIQSRFDAYGIEPSPRFCEFAQKELNLEIWNGTLEDCVQASGRKFDVITLHHVLEHVESPHTLLESLKEFLSDDGIIFIEVPNTQSLTSQTIDMYFRLKGLRWSSRLSPLHPPFHKYGYNPKSLRYLLREHEYDVCRLTTFSGFSRGFKDAEKSSKFLGTMRSAVISTVDLLGNRDMLAVIVKK